MRRVFAVFVPLLVLLLAAGLACVLGYFVALGLGDAVPLRKIISKFTQLLLVLSIFPAMAYLGLKKADLGFAVRGVFFRQLLRGLLLGFFTLMPVFVVLYALQVLVLDAEQQWSVAQIVQKMGLSLLLALLIAWIEEPLFRGLLLAGLRQKISLAAAIIVSAFYYASLHFLETKTQVPWQELNFWSGFGLLGEALQNMLNPQILPAWIALFMVGIFLAVLRSSVDCSLGMCIGCHASWVWQIKMSKSLFNNNYGADYAFLVSRYYDGVVGPMVAAWLGVALVSWYVFFGRKVLRQNTFR